MVIARAIGLVLASLMLVGCQNMVANSGIYYNVGLAEATNNLLLANVIRSAKGYPNYYSLIGDYSGSTSSSISPSVSGSLQVPRHGQPVSFDLGMSGSAGRDKNANVSSLETRDFTRAMHTLVTPQLLLFLVDSRDGAHLHLVLAMLVKTNRVKLKDYNAIVLGARDVCERRFATLSSAEKGICRNFEAVLSDVTCDFARERSASGDTIITLRNHPTNRCAFTQFRMFSEAVMLNGGTVEINKDGKLDVTFSRTGSGPRSLFKDQGTGITLRSPNGIVHYLGEIVRDQFRREGAWTPALTMRDGRNVPIFRVKRGFGGGRSAVSAEVDGESFWIPRQKLGARESDFSYRALTIVKDFQALNTGQDAIPTSPAIILGPGSSAVR